MEFCSYKRKLKEKAEILFKFFKREKLVNLIKSNKNNTLQVISNILDATVDKDDYKLEFKNELYLLNLKQSMLIKIVKILKENEQLKFNQLIDLTAVDYPNKKNRFEMIYILLSVDFNFRIIIKFFINENESVDSITNLFPAANWYEREVWDLFGIAFNNHPDLRRLLTDYGFIGHPLRKDFPLSGNVEVKYDLNEKKVVYEPVKLTQSFREFEFESPWKGEKLDNNNE